MSSTGAARIARLRARRRAGRIVVTVEVDEGLSDVLASAGYLAPQAADDPCALKAAVERLLGDLTAVDLVGI